MSSVRKDERTGNWSISFRYGGKRCCKSTKTADKKVAHEVMGRVDETIRLLERGSLEIPPDADVGTWIFSGGKLAEKPVLVGSGLSQLGEMAEAYVADQHGKAENTLYGEQIHIRHLKRSLKASSRLSAVNLATLQAYVGARRKEKWRGNVISGKTIRKELVTFCQIWDWAKARRHVNTHCPIYNEQGKWAVEIPLNKDRLPFMPLAEIQERIKRGGLTAAEIKELKGALFLDATQVGELLEHVAAYPHPFVLPMFAMAGLAGMRRSKIIRSHVADFDFAGNRLKVRERKRKKGKAESVRFVPISPRLAEIMRAWFAVHSGGQFTISRKPGGMSVDASPHYFKEALKGSVLVHRKLEFRPAGVSYTGNASC